MKPFFKWAGGKRKQASTIIGEMGDLAAVKYYVEPFLGGGAVFFKLTEYDLSNKLVMLNDLNPEIANVYYCVKTHPTEVVDLFDSWGSDTATYYKVRDWLPSYATPGDRIRSAARFLFLNKYGFNGLYRLNSKGKFNVPFGKPAAGKSDLDVENLVQAGLTLGVRAALNNTTVVISCFDYTRTISEVAAHRSGPMVIYCDPPYMPVTSTSFTKYTADGFGEADHRKLRNLLEEVYEPGDTFLVSNSPAALEIFDGWEKIEIQAPRSINSKGEGRNNVTEYLFKKAT